MRGVLAKLGDDGFIPKDRNVRRSFKVRCVNLQSVKTKIELTRKEIDQHRRYLSTNDKTIAVPIEDSNQLNNRNSIAAHAKSIIVESGSRQSDTKREQNSFSRSLPPKNTRELLKQIQNGTYQPSVDH